MAKMNDLTPGIAVGARGEALRNQGYPDSTSGAYKAKPIDYTYTPDKKKDLSGGATSDNSDYLNALLARYNGTSNAKDYLNSMRSAAQAAYDRGMSSLTGAKQSMIDSLDKNLESALSSLRSEYNRQAGIINDNANNSLRNAYITNQVSQKNLPQRLASMGLRGGATETAQVNLDNNYGSARNYIDTTRQNNLSDLAANLQTNESSALQNYNSALANVEWQTAQQMMALENALANNEMSTQKDYYSMLMDENEQALNFMKSLGITNFKNANIDPNMFNATWLNNISALPEQKQTEVNNAALLKALEELGITV